MTGGGSGLEASPVPYIIATSAGAYLAYRAVQSGHVAPPFWSRAKVTPALRQARA